MERAALLWNWASLASCPPCSLFGCVFTPHLLVLKGEASSQVRACHGTARVLRPTSCLCISPQLINLGSRRPALCSVVSGGESGNRDICALGLGTVPSHGFGGAAAAFWSAGTACCLPAWKCLFFCLFVFLINKPFQERTSLCGARPEEGALGPQSERKAGLPLARRVGTSVEKSSRAPCVVLRGNTHLCLRTLTPQMGLRWRVGAVLELVAGLLCCSPRSAAAAQLHRRARLA